MDHFMLTLIIGTVEVLFVPWAAWVTVRVFEIAARQSVMQNQMDNEVKFQKDQNIRINKSLQELEHEVADVKEQINTGFRDVMEALRK